MFRAHRYLFSLFVITGSLTACMQQATFIKETPDGGVVGFTFTQQVETVSSGGRSDAVLLMTQKCPNGFLIGREGIVPRINEKVDKKWRGTVNNVYDGGVEERQWGIQFTCK